MPIYEYACKSCQGRFEQFVRSPAEEKDVACPTCESRKIERLPSVFATHARSAPAMLPRAGGCGRCGDPNGPCGVG